MPSTKKSHSEKWFLTVQVWGPDGKCKSHSRKRMHSHVVQYIQHIRGALNNAGEASVKDTGGTLRTINYANTGLSYMKITATADGIRVGTGTTAEAITQNAIATAIVDGTGAGQLSYQTQQINLVRTIGGLYSAFSIVRTFTNNSAGSITVNEVALYATTADNGSVDRQFMLARDLITAAVVAVGDILLVGYEARASV